MKHKIYDFLGVETREKLKRVIQTYRRQGLPGIFIVAKHKAPNRKWHGVKIRMTNEGAQQLAYQLIKQTQPSRWDGKPDGCICGLCDDLRKKKS